ncbi:rhodanese-like domain-containing protein [Nocardioides sp. MAHUQ-72]|uniref:rhodanese-like domain-containing protein n=1 Tax=unclassified Nocardioides TaxID=2615069 RepID=UPI003622BE4A
MDLVTLEVPELGNRCHLVHDGSSALVVDPPRDLAVVERAAATVGVEIAAVADTHVHNDYVSGALALARRHGADYLLSADEHVEFERVGVRGGDVLTVGGLQVRVIDTPGHTRHHQSFLATGTTDEPGVLLSGGSLLLGTVGRTDLVDPRLTHDLARAQWASARTLAALDDATLLRPTHGFGSFCAGSTPCSTGGDATLGDERASNPALVLDREEFVDQLVAGLGPIPSYYRHMAPLNRAGAGRALPRAARAVTAHDVTDAILRGSWVVDLRGRAAYAEGHVSGSVSVEYGTQFATYVGWLVPWQDDIVLLTDSPTLLAPALRDLAAIGIDGVDTHVLDGADQLTASYRRTDWAGFRAAPGPRVVVDVRQRDEYEAGHLPGALHLPVQDVEERGATLPSGELWVHCRSGYRAGIAASLLHRMGRSVVHVDDAWDRVAELAIPTTPGLAA